MEGNDNEMAKKVDYFFKEKALIHILCTDGRFYNGSILEMDADFFIIIDRYNGETPIFFCELKRVERFREIE